MDLPSSVDVPLGDREVPYGDLEMQGARADVTSGSAGQPIRKMPSFRRASDLMTASAKIRNDPNRKDWHVKLFKTPKEATLAIATGGENKAKQPADKTFFLGVLGGMYVAFGGMFAQTVAYGMPNSDPGTQRLAYGILFPTALILIVFSGGELFTGNAMYMSTAVAFRKIKVRHLLTNWFFAYFGNLCGCLFFAYIFGYLTDLFATDPWLTKILAIAPHKTSLPWRGVFFSAMAANSLVCLAVFMGVASEDMVSKTFVMFLPVAAFASCQFEHCVANMYNLSISLYYGAPVAVSTVIVNNLLPVTLGNLIGGMFVGLSHWYLYGVREDIEDTFPAVNPLRFTFTAKRPPKLPQ